MKLEIAHLENNIIANITIQHSKTQFELEQLYIEGMKELKMAKMKLGDSTDKFIRFYMWWVRKATLKYSQEKFTTQIGCALDK